LSLLRTGLLSQFEGQHITTLQSPHSARVQRYSAYKYLDDVHGILNVWWRIFRHGSQQLFISRHWRHVLPIANVHKFDWQLSICFWGHEIKFHLHDATKGYVNMKIHTAFLFWRQSRLIL